MPLAQIPQNPPTAKIASHYNSPVESRPVFADPSGRRHQILRFAGFGSMAAIAACLVAVVMAMTGGPQAPFTQWAAPQAPATAKQNPQQAGTRPLDHATAGGAVGSHSGGGP